MKRTQISHSSSRLFTVGTASLAILLAWSSAHAVQIFTESFESPDVTGEDMAVDSPGWITTENSGYQRLVDVDSELFTTPYGSQALRSYTRPSAGAWSYSMTSDSILDAPLDASLEYTLSFHVAAGKSNPSAYRAELVTVDESEVITVLATKAGLNDGSSDMSYSDSITFATNASHSALLGQRLAIRLSMDYAFNELGANYQDKPYFDNVVLDAESPLRPSPADGAVVLPGTISLGWVNFVPKSGNDVWVDVWYGTDPEALTQVVDAEKEGLNATTTSVSPSGADTYYWRIDSYLDGSATGTPTKGPVFTFVIADSDADGLPDTFELEHSGSSTGLNPGDDLENGGAGDGLTNLEEYQHGTDPTNSDTDGDTLEDGAELAGAGARPATDPTLNDTDGDGVNDGMESNTGTWVDANDRGTDPTNTDTDGDNLLDGVESNTGTFASAEDTGTNPLNSNSDADNAEDWYEVAVAYTDPTDASDQPITPYPLPDQDDTPGASDKPVKVYILSGQSNMYGYGQIAGGLPGTLEYMTSKENKFPNLLDDEGGWTQMSDVYYRGVVSDVARGPMSAVVAKGANKFGPELGFGFVMGYYHDEPVLVLKSSIGNRSLGWDCLPPDSPQTRFTDGEGVEWIYAGYGDSPNSWKVGTTADPVAWYGGKTFDTFFRDEADMNPKLGWSLGQVYPAKPVFVRHNGVVYKRVKKGAHTATADTEPGVGADWQSAWAVYSDFNVTDVLDNFATEYPDWAAQGFEIAGFVWWQGHKDGGQGGTGNAGHYALQYENNLKNLILKLREYYAGRYPESGAADAPFVVATVGFSAGAWEPGSSAQTIFDAQMNVSKPSKHPNFDGNVASVDTTGYWRDSGPGNQSFHYNWNAETYMLVGDATGRAMVELLADDPDSGDSH